MRRGKGFAFDALALVSLLAALWIAFAWARSRLPGKSHLYWLRDGPAVIAIDCPADFYDKDVTGRGPQQAWDWFVRDSATEAHAAIGLRFARGTYHGYSYALLGAPYALLLAVTLVLPAAWMMRRLRTRRRAVSGQCAACG